MLPNFVGLGVQKAGTTSLYHYLRLHPEVYLPETEEINYKEINFFFHDYLYEKGLPYYETFFKAWNGEKAVGEISPDYLYNPVCRYRIRESLKDLKFITIFRNPIDRAYSNYWMEESRGNENLTFSDAIEQESERIKAGLFEKNTFSYVHRGFYFEQITAYIDEFQDSEFLFLLGEDLRNDRVNTLSRIFRFLGISDRVVPNIDIEYHTASRMRWKWLHHYLTTPHWSKLVLKSCVPVFHLRGSIRLYLHKHNVKNFTPPPMEEAVRDRLREVFFESNEKLAKLIGRDLSHWK